MTSLESNPAYARLKHAYENPLETALEKHREGVPVAGYTSNTVPWELLRATGFFPVLLQAHTSGTPHADVYMEPVFTRRIRSLFEVLLGGTWSFLKTLVIPRTSEQEHKLYLYLSEAIRQEQQCGQFLSPTCSTCCTRVRRGLGRMDWRRRSVCCPI